MKLDPSTGGFRPQAYWRFRGSNASLALGFWPQLYAAALPPDGALQDGLPAIEPSVSASNLSRLCCPWLSSPPANGIGRRLAQQRSAYDEKNASSCGVAPCHEG